MLVFRIIATILIGLSCLTAALKNISIFGQTTHPNRDVIIATNWSWLWRAFVIVALWII